MTKAPWNILYASARGDLSGGGQVSLLKLLERIPRERITPILMTPTDGDLVQAAHKLNIETIVWDLSPVRLFSPFAVFRDIKRARNFLKEHQIALVHTDAPRSTFYWGLAARRKKVPVVWHARVSTPDSLLDFINYRLVTKIIAVSEGAAQRFGGVKGKVRLIYNAADIEEFKKPDWGKRFKQDFAFSDAHILIGTAGKLYELKRQEDLVRAAAIVIEKCPNAIFLMAGDGDKEYQAFLTKLAAEIGVENHVKFLGRRSDIPDFFGALDIFTLNSRTEGLPRVAVEAMAAGKPVVASDIVGNRDVVVHGETGYLYPLYNYRALAKYLIELAQDADQRRKFGEAARERAQKVFSLEKNLHSTLALYEELLGK